MENSIMSAYKVRKIILTLWLLVAVIIVNGQEVVTTSNVNLRSGPSTTSQILTQIPQGTTIDLDNCQSDWCSVRISGHDGYIAKRYTMPASKYKSYRENTREQAHPTGQVKYYKNSKGNTVQSPTRYNSVPEGATAECRDGTYSFSQSRRGTCSHHGGVRRWLK